MELNESMEERHVKATLRKECECGMHCVAAGGRRLQTHTASAIAGLPVPSVSEITGRAVLRKAR